MKKCAFDERMGSGLRLEKWDLMCNLLGEIKYLPQCEQKENEKKESEKANKRQRDQMGIYFLALQQGVAPRMIH